MNNTCSIQKLYSFFICLWIELNQCNRELRNIHMYWPGQRIQVFWSDPDPVFEKPRIRTPDLVLNTPKLKITLNSNFSCRLKL